MAGVNLAVIYYSATGTNYQMAKWAAESGRQAGAAVKVLRVEELATEEAIDSNPAWKAHVEATKDVPVAKVEDLVWADAIIFSMPSRFGNVPSQMKQFLDMTGGIWSKGKLVNKVVSAMSSADNPHGGQESTIKAIYTTMMHWGAIIAAPGYSDPSLFEAGGNPYGASVTVDTENHMIEKVEDAVRYQGARTVTISSWIKQGHSRWNE
ncbi:MULTISPECIES: NAD(P)H:quinone oxidoreductase [Sporosarcina]|uniref:NAD(P)H:quinone oxidoreductase n=1 Tax=Sporosarcina TaxID=1569 RepID=UPI00129A13CD|nr:MULTISPECIES: NAD(P)H:quinone oxidoreductase [Sporosarcina]GKV65326.1 NAD(P)H dehydrogenase (quinone) [Sporosarcina sp. NCCP-2331]GLB55450.1 NAD(P)H dehydrogenase (quinone) [Sporosarcina sp. NCCP-2378]